MRMPSGAGLRSPDGVHGALAAELQAAADVDDAPNNDRGAQPFVGDVDPPALVAGFGIEGDEVARNVLFGGNRLLAGAGVDRPVHRRWRGGDAADLDAPALVAARRVEGGDRRAVPGIDR